jgi:hypothetical protein
MQEEQGTAAACHGARIMRFPIGEEEDAVALLCTHTRQRVFSCLLHHNCLQSSLCDGLTPAREVRRRVDA